MDTNSKYLENAERLFSQSLYQVLNMKLGIFLGAFTKRIVIAKLAVAGRRSVPMAQSDTHSYGFCEISYLEVLRKLSKLSNCG